MKTFLVTIFSFLFAQNLLAQKGFFDFNQNCAAAYGQYYSLNLEEGTAIIEKEKKVNPNNLLTAYLEDYEDCMLLLFNGDEEELKARFPHFDQRLETISKGNPNSPWYLFSKAGLYFHWALVQFRFGENVKAVLNFRRSFLLLKENKEKFPAFMQNNILYGAQETVLGTIPDDYKWIAGIFGMRGDVKKGLASIASFINTKPSNEPLKEEAIIIHTYLRYYLLHEQEEAWDFIMSKQFSCEGNLLRSFVRANIGLNFRKSDIALATLKAAEKLPHYNKYPIFEYEMGTALLFNLNDGAVNCLYRFVTGFKGKYYVKEALYKMALSYYLQNNLEKAKAAKSAVAKYGAKTTDADKQAERLSKREDWPALDLIQAKELFDGGNYQEALSKLIHQKPEDYTNPIDKVEYYYRMGRIYDETNHVEKAISFYKYAIVLGRNREEYFASRAAFQLGLIYEKQGNKKVALTWFKDCISMKNHDYKASIDQQAKAAINRLEENK